MSTYAFFGTPYVARDTLAILVERGFPPAVVITSPDALKGRGLALAPSDTKAWALEHGQPVLTPDTLDAAAIDAIRAYGCDYAIVVAYGKILPQALIDAFPKGILNVHYSLLPRYRGASPVEGALLHGDSVTGVTIQKMAFQLDAGDVLAQQETAIGPEETTPTLRARLIEMGANLLADTLPFFVEGTAAFTPQDESKATRSGKMKKEDGELSLADDPVRNWNKYRAYAAWPGTYFFTDRGGKRTRVKIAKASFAHGAFVIERVVPEGKKEMSYADFSR